MKLFKSKKGSEDNVVFGPLFWIVVTAASALVIFLITAKLLGGVQGETDRITCKNQVLLQSATMKFTEDLIKPDCKTYNIKFSENKVEKDSEVIKVYDASQEKYVKKFESLNDDIVNRVVADELTGCWNQFWEGKKSIQSSAALFPVDGENCFICDEFFFDQDVKKQSFTGFYQFTKDKYLPNSEKTYYDYYAEADRISADSFYDQDSNKNSWEEYADGTSTDITFCADGIRSTVLGISKRPPVVKDIVFEKNKFYSVVFIRQGKSVANLFYEKKATTESICSTEAYFAYVLESSEIPKQCDSVVRGDP